MRRKRSTFFPSMGRSTPPIISPEMEEAVRRSPDAAQAVLRARRQALPVGGQMQKGLGEYTPLKANWADRLAMFGAALMDIDPILHGGNLNNAKAHWRDSQNRHRTNYEMDRRRSLMEDAMKGLTPGQRSLAELSPDTFVKERYAQMFPAQAKPKDPIKVGRDDSIYDPNTGQFLHTADPKTERPVVASPGSHVIENGEVTHRVPHKPYAPNRNGITIGPDGSVQIGGPARLPEAGKPPKGYQYVRDENGNIIAEVIPGGPVDRANENRQKRAERAGGTVVQDLGRALNLFETAQSEGNLLDGVGPIEGWLTSKFPGTPADRIRRLVESAKSNIGIDQLQAMRDASPTGGALGQVPVQQQVRLETMLGDLVNTQNVDDWRNNIMRTINLYNDIIHGPDGGPERFDLNFDYQGRPLDARPEGVSQQQWFNSEPGKRPKPEEMSDDEILEELGLK